MCLSSGLVVQTTSTAPSVQPASSSSSCSGSGGVFAAPPDAPAEAAMLPPGAGSA